MFSLIQSQKPHRRRSSSRMSRVLRDAARGGAIESLEDRALLADVPQLSSLPGAPVTIYLDFDGHVESDSLWNQQNTNGVDIVTPEFSTQPPSEQPESFSDVEAAQMEEIWARVAEDFSPFTVNVTTIDPGVYNDYSSILVSIGGDGSWLGQPGETGVSFRNAFSNSAPNTIFVFSELYNDTDDSDGLDPANTHAIASTISHEAGHAFGLRNNSLYDSNGSVIEELHPGFGEYGPIMGNAEAVIRDVWFNGPADRGPDDIQLDMEEMTRPSNRTFRFREDDHGGTINSASLPTFDDNGRIAVSDNVLTTHTDVDVFEIGTDTGNISFTVNALDLGLQFATASTPGNNVDLTLRLLDVNGDVVAEDSPANSYNATVSFSATRGTYYVEVSSIDQYGSAGEYDLTGNIIPLPQTPTLLTPADDEIINDATPRFTYTQTPNTRSYEIRVDSLTTGESDVIRVSDITTTFYTHDVPLPEGQYRASVRSISSTGEPSEFSQTHDFEVDIDRPGTPVLTGPVGQQDPLPLYTWDPASGANSYTLTVRDRTTDLVVLTRTGIADTSYRHFQALPAGSYAASVVAVNEVGEGGPPSREINFQVESPVAEVPQFLTPADRKKTGSRRPKYSWTAAANAVRYEIRVHFLSGRVNNIIRIDDIEGTNFRPSDQLEQGTYRAWVRAYNILDEVTEWSDPLVVIVDVPTSEAPVVTGPNSEVGTQTPTITWETTTNRARSFRIIVVDQNQDGAQVYSQEVGQTLSHVPTRRLPQSDSLVVFVAGINVLGEIGDFGESEFAIDVATPARPEITGPTRNSNGTVSNPNPTFTWTPVENAFSYDLKIVDLTTGETIIRETSLKVASFTPTISLPDGHQIRATVRSRNTAGEKSAFSANYDFIAKREIPSTPTLLGPTGSQPSRTPVFEWTITSGATRYQLFVKDLDTGSTARFNINNWDTSPDGSVASTQLSTRLRRGTTYQTWIRAIGSGGGNSGNSNSTTFTIQASYEDIEHLLDLDQTVADIQPAEAPQATIIETDESETVVVETATTPAVSLNTVIEISTSDENQSAPAPVAVPEASDPTVFNDTDWWTGDLESTDSTEQAETSSKQSDLAAGVKVAAGVFAIPMLAAKLLRRARAKKKNQK